MAEQRPNQSWEDLERLGKNISGIIDKAVNSRDFQQLNNTITQAVNYAVRASSHVVEQGSRLTRVGSMPPASPPAPKSLPVLYRKTAMKKVAAGAMLGGGTTLLSLCGILLLVKVLTMGFSWGGAIPMLLGAGAAVALIARGGRNLSFLHRFEIYVRTLGNKTQCAIARLAERVQRSEKYVRKDLKSMIREGLFFQGHLDREEQNLLTSHETYRLFEQSRLELEQQKLLAAEEAKLRPTAPELSPQVQEVLDKGNAYLRRIKACNDAIPGEEISAKISRMELLVQKIFDRVRSHPEVVSDLKKMMDYYLPMTVKLLDAYAEMDRQPIQGETIQSSKKEIEATLDTLNRAFESLLDNVFRDTALDISSDISVLHTMLAQEGLTDDGLGKIKK